MLTEGKIDSLDTHLEQFKLNNQTAQDDMQVNSARIGHALKVINHK
jgi:hypothetical protein